jgi:phosphohistidine swiveling domain-containing protein
VDRTTKSWSERLAHAIKDGTWVKGAVNYDEDLHFSTYYLRASCSHETQPLYPGYTTFVASYEGFKETYWLLESECLATAMAIVARALEDPTWLPGVLEEIRRRSDALAGIFRAGTSPERLAKLSNTELLATYERHDQRNRSLYQVARLPEALDRGGSYFTGYLTECLRQHGIPDADLGRVFAVLSRPTTPSVLAQEILEFDDIVRDARARRPVVPVRHDGSSRARLFLAPGILERLDEHRARWQFLAYHGYGRRQLSTLDDYVRRLDEQQRSTAPLMEKDALAVQARAAADERRALLEKLGIDAGHAALFEVYPEIGAVKLYRRYAQLRNFYSLDMLLAEIARRLRTSEWTVRCMLPEEVIASLRTGKLQKASSLRERLEGCVFARHEGVERVVTGSEAGELRELLRPARPARTGNVLHGVVASRGKVSGPCKVVIRADDCAQETHRGAIIVSESTDPDLVPILRTATGVLTEQGGVTSHAAIICRELGVPTIIGIEGLLETVRDGDWLEVDAEQGTVTVTPRSELADGTEQLDPAVVGAKAHNLGLVRSRGFRVPEYVLLDFERVERASREGGCRDLATRVLSQLRLGEGERLVIRSSSTFEDGDDRSGAGDFESILGVRAPQLAEALARFVESNKTGRSGAPYRGSVIVQRMIDADCAGVCLTRDGRTGTADSVIVEMTAGGNQGITGGTIRPDRVVVDRLTGDVLVDERRSETLKACALDATGMVQQFLALELRFGKPLDIEWAIAGRELYILQARPIVHREPG